MWYIYGLNINDNVVQHLCLLTKRKALIKDRQNYFSIHAKGRNSRTLITRVCLKTARYNLVNILFYI